MEVIVEDSQLSLAIGKKGQNVRLAAKLMGWKIDIKTEEEKRQEVEAAMTALSTGSPLSALIDFGLPEPVLDLLLGAAVGTVERVGSMTPEELEAIEGISSESVQQIVFAVNGFYSNMDAAAQAAAQAAQAAPPAVTDPDAGEGSAPVESEPEIADAAAQSVPPSLEEPGAEEAVAATEPESDAAQAVTESAIPVQERVEEASEAGQAGEPSQDESDTMKAEGLPVEES